MNKIILFTLFVLLANVSGWSNCFKSQTGWNTYKNGNCKGIVYGTCGDIQCSGWNSYSPCKEIYKPSDTRFYYTGLMYECPATFDVFCVYRYRCDTKTEADSANCINQGNQWIDDHCKLSSCTPSDTSWLKTSISACQDIRGSNNYALVDTNDVCEHRGHCCALDSLIEGEGCKWRCLSQDSLCTLKKGNFSYAIVADTAVSGSDTTYTGLCYNNCFMYASKDGKTGLVTGNSVMSQTSDPISAGLYYPDGFKGVRSEAVGIYTYDFLSDENYEWADSLLSAPCSVGMYRGIKNGKYVYWKSGQPVPEGVTNVVKVK